MIYFKIKVNLPTKSIDFFHMYLTVFYVDKKQKVNSYLQIKIGFN